MKLIKKLLLGFLIGAIILFAVPIFPISLNNLKGDASSTWFISGITLLKNGFSIPLVFLLCFIGGLFGSLISLFFVSDKD